MADSKMNVIVSLVDKLSEPAKKIQNDLKGITDKSKAVGNELSNAFNKGKTDMRSFQAASQQVGAGLLAFGAAVTYGLKGAVDVAAEFEHTLSGLKAVSGATAEEMDKLRQQALEVGASTSKSANDVALAQEMLAKNGMAVVTMLEGATEATIALSEATGGDLAGSADIMTDVMAIFGKEAKDLTDVIDGITGVTVKSKFTIDDFRLALAQGGGVAGAVGVTMEDFNTTIAAIAPSFASGSDAGTSFKVMLQRLVPQGKPATEMMHQLGIITEESGNRFFDAEGNMKSMSDIAGILQESMKGLSDEQRNMALSTLFGTDAMRAGAQLAKVGSEGFEDLAKSIEEVNAAAQAAERLNNLSGAMEELKGAAETAMITIGAALIPVIQGFTTVITNVINVFNSLPAPLQKGIAMFGALAAAFALIAGPILMFIGFLPMLKAGLLLIATVIGGLSTALAGLALPITAVIAALGLLYLAWKNNFGGIQEFARSWWTEITETFKGVATEVSLFVENFTQEFWAWYYDNKEIIDGFITVVSVLIDGFLQGLMIIWTTFWTALKIVVRAGWEVIKGTFAFWFNVLQGDWAGAWESFKGIFTGIWDGLTTYMTKWFDNALARITDFVKNAGNKIKNLFSIGYGDKGGGVSGERATGGYVSAGSSYLVGEKGAEVFSPTRSGYIIPNNKLGGGGTTVVVNVAGSVVSERDLAEKLQDLFIQRLQKSNLIV